MTMDATRWRRIEQLFHEASALPPGEHQRWLAEACGGDEQLARDVLQLLAADRQSETSVLRGIADASHSLVAGGPDAEHFRGMRIGAWRIDRQLGEGGMGLVFLAHRDDGRFEQQAAIKLLRFTLATQAAVDRFRRERRILARLDHPHIARLLDAGEHAVGGGAEIPYFVMEYVEGEPLTAYARRRGLTPRQRVELYQQVLDAVGYAHQRFVLHRDVKPANILVNARGEVKLLDFGIAQLLEGDPTDAHERTRSIMMTPDYASPEQLRGEPLTVQSDVFTLGTLLYELLGDRRAYDNPTRTPLTDRVTAMAAAPAAPLGIDSDLDTIVAKAMHLDLERRYPSVEAFSADLRRYRNGQPVSARRDSAWYRARKFTSRHRWPIAAAAVLVLSLAGGIVSTAYEARRANQHLAQLRQLSGRLLFQIHDAVGTLQGATKARELLVSTSAEYLDGLSADAGDDPAFLTDLASAYERLGRIQGGPNSGHLGRIDDALASYRKASDVFERLESTNRGDREIVIRQARIAVAMGRVQALNGREDAAPVHLKDAIDLGRKVTSADQLLPDETLDAMLYLGDIAFDKGRPDEALDYYQQAWPHSERGAQLDPSPSQQRGLMNIRIRIGRAQIFTGDLASAHREFQQAYEFARVMAVKMPDNAVARRDAFLLLDQLAALTGHPDRPNLGDPRGGAALYDEAVAVAEKIVASDPQDIRARRDLAETSAGRAATLRDLAPEQSRAQYQRVFEIYAAMPESYTKAANVSQWLAQHRRGLGLSLAGMSRFDAALQELDRALAEFKRLQLAKDMGVALQDIAHLRMRKGQMREARAAAEESIATLESARHERPNDVSLRRDLAGAYAVMGRIAGATAGCEAERQWMKRREQLWQELAGTQAAEYAAAELKRLASNPSSSGCG
jgi:tetratricopeptide (TPR) repeat protein